MEIPGVGDQDTVEAAAVAEPAVDLGVYGIPHLWTKPFEDGSIPTGQWWDEHPFALFTSYLGVRSMILAPGPNPFGPFVQSNLPCHGEKSPAFDGNSIKIPQLEMLHRTPS